MAARRIIIRGITFLMMLLSPTGSPWAATDSTEKVEDATKVLEEIMESPDKGIPASLLADAHGVAVIPGVVKVGFVVGGRRGGGIMVIRDDNGAWSRPCFIKITGGSVGWQIGAQSTDVILVFGTKRSVDGIVDGKFTLGADASVAAGPVGRHAEAGTDTKLEAEILSYSRNRGFFAGVSLEGAKLQVDHDANSDFYGKADVTAQQVLGDRDLETPEVARKFIKILAGLTNAKKEKE